MANIIIEQITKDPAICGGKACIAGHRVRIMDIAIMREQMGMSVDEIVLHLPMLSLSDVHAALAYYYDNIDEIREEIRQEQEFIAEFRRQHPSTLQ
ncbi:MAG: DUF433 domain-containing protein, partial [Acidobacteria bacterium]|nr:DUF433 domain-containing protein [Acidobacteriota bacterium]